MALLSLNRRFVRLLRKEACYCRLSPADKDGAIRHVLYANWRQPVAWREDIEIIDLLDINTPWRDLAIRLGRIPGDDGKRRVRTKSRKFAVLTRVPTADSTYYPIPYYGSLFRITEWYDTTIRHWFTATLFPFIDLANLSGFTDHRWANYLGLRSNAIDIEQRIAEEFVSPEQLAVFREEVFSMTWDFSLTATSHTQIIERLRSVIVSVLQGNNVPVQSLRDIVDFMRKHEDHFPEFRASHTYKLFEPPIFENKKQYHGYWF